MGKPGNGLAKGSDNIDIDKSGNADESGVIRIGTSPTEKAAYAAGISTSTITGASVYVTSAGQLGVLASSELYKTAIKPLQVMTRRSSVTCGRCLII